MSTHNVCFYGAHDENYKLLSSNTLSVSLIFQTRQEPSCLLSPITEENAVERVAKELVNTYGGQNSHR